VRRAAFNTKRAFAYFAFADSVKDASAYTAQLDRCTEIRERVMSARGELEANRTEHRMLSVLQTDEQAAG
jgi:hypothetical protein